MRKRRWGKRIRMRFAHRPEKLLAHHTSGRNAPRSPLDERLRLVVVADRARDRIPYDPVSAF